MDRKQIEAGRFYMVQLDYFDENKTFDDELDPPVRMLIENVGELGAIKCRKPNGLILPDEIFPTDFAWVAPCQILAVAERIAKN